MSVPALNVERYEELCRTVSLFLKPDDALDVLSLMALATPPVPYVSPLDLAIHRLGTMLNVVIEPEAKKVVFDWEIHGQLT